VIAVAALGAAIVFAVGLLFWFVFRRMWIVWLLPVLAWVVAVAAAAVKGTTLTRAACSVSPAPTGCGTARAAPQWVEGLLIPVVVALAVAWIVRAYDRRRPGVWKWAAALTVLPVVGLGLEYVQPSGASSRLVGGWIRAFEVLYASLLGSWVVFYVLGVAA